MKVVPEDNADQQQAAQRPQQPAQQQPVLQQLQQSPSQMQYQQSSISPTSSYPIAAPGAQQGNYVQSAGSFSPISSAPMVQQQSPYYSSPNPIPVASCGFAHQQYNVNSPSIDAESVNPLAQQQPEVTPVCAQSAYGTPATPSSAQQGPHGSPYDVGQHSVPSSSGYSSNDSSADTSGLSAGRFANVDAQRSPDGSSGQRTPPSMSDMGMQFMVAMHQSVSQVLDQPHFGFEWVKPDYHFDGLIDADELAVALGSTPEFDGQLMESSPENDTDSPRSKSSRRSSASDSDTSNEIPRPPSKDAADASALTPKAMEELYDELEKYSELYCQ